MVAAQTGLGAIIWYGKDWGNLALVLVGMVGISITVLLADVIAERIERLLLPWERHRRG
jgi:taurine transport system permease protein